MYEYDTLSNWKKQPSYYERMAAAEVKESHEALTDQELYLKAENTSKTHQDGLGTTFDSPEGDSLMEGSSVALDKEYEGAGEQMGLKSMTWDNGRWDTLKWAADELNEVRRGTYRGFRILVNGVDVTDRPCMCMVIQNGKVTDIRDYTTGLSILNENDLVEINLEIGWSVIAVSSIKAK